MRVFVCGEKKKKKKGPIVAVLNGLTFVFSDCGEISVHGIL